MLLSVTVVIAKHGETLSLQNFICTANSEVRYLTQRHATNRESAYIADNLTTASIHGSHAR